MEQTLKNEHTGKKSSPKVELENENIGWGWVVCFAGFMINFTTAGICSSNGILLLGLIDRYNATVSKTATTGSLFLAAIMCIGPLSLGLLTFQVSHRQVIMLGGLVASLSTLASAFVSRIEVLFVTYGIITGSAIGMCNFAGNTLVGSYFSKKRSLAVGIATSGGGCGSIALAYLTERSLSFYGVPGTFMLLSGLFLNYIVYGALCRPLNPQTHKNKDSYKGVKLNSVGVLQTETASTKEYQTCVINTITKSNGTCEEPKMSNHEKASPVINTDTNKCRFFCSRLFNPTVFGNPCMQLLVLNYFFWSAVEIALIYLPAKVVDILVREKVAWIMCIYGIGLSFGEIVIGFLIEILHIPASFILLSSMLAIFICLVGFTFCGSFIEFVLCTIVISISNGITISLRVVFVASILGVENLNKGYCPLSIMIGFGYIIHSYIAGALFDAIHTFDAVFHFAAANLVVSSILISGIAYREMKGKFRPLGMVLMTFRVSHRQVIISGELIACLATIVSVFSPRLELHYFTFGILTEIKMV